MNHQRNSLIFRTNLQSRRHRPVGHRRRPCLRTTVIMFPKDFLAAEGAVGLEVERSGIPGRNAGSHPPAIRGGNEGFGVYRLSPVQVNILSAQSRRRPVGSCGAMHLVGPISYAGSATSSANERSSRRRRRTITLLAARSVKFDRAGPDFSAPGDWSGVITLLDAGAGADICRNSSGWHRCCPHYPASRPRLYTGRHGKLR